MAYNESVATLKQATLLFLVKDDEILLAMKKRGFGVGRWNGVGGKPDANETTEQTAIRECDEEIVVVPQTLKHVATLDFYFPSDKSDWNQQVIVYFCTKWQGVPTETDEMSPAWYKISNIPYDKMWKDDKYWLPEVLKGRFVKARFQFDNKDGVLSHKLEVLQQID